MLKIIGWIFTIPLMLMVVLSICLFTAPVAFFVGVPVWTIGELANLRNGNADFSSIPSCAIDFAFFPLDFLKY